MGDIICLATWGKECKTWSQGLYDHSPTIQLKIFKISGICNHNKKKTVTQPSRLHTCFLMFKTFSTSESKMQKLEIIKVCIHP